MARTGSVAFFLFYTFWTDNWLHHISYKLWFSQLYNCINQLQSKRNIRSLLTEISSHHEAFPGFVTKSFLPHVLHWKCADQGSGLTINSSRCAPLTDLRVGRHMGFPPGQRAVSCGARPFTTWSKVPHRCHINREGENYMAVPPQVFAMHLFTCQKIVIKPECQSSDAQKTQGRKHCSLWKHFYHPAINNVENSPNTGTDPKDFALDRLCTINQKAKRQHQVSCSSFSLWLVNICREKRNRSGRTCQRIPFSVFFFFLFLLWFFLSQFVQAWRAAFYPTVYLLKDIPGSEIPNNGQDM